MHAVNMLSLPAQRCLSMSEMSGSENIPCCPHMAMHLIELSHDLLSSGYAYDSVPPGRAMMERDKCHACQRSQTSYHLLDQVQRNLSSDSIWQLRPVSKFV